MQPTKSSILGRLGAVGLALALAACSRAEAAPDKPGASDAPVRVTTSQVEERTFPSTLTLTGSLTANQVSFVASDGAGKVVKVFVERGSSVKKGDVLAKLDARESALAAAEAGSSLETARAQARHAKLECERAERLYAAQVIARAEYDRTKAACATNDANLGAAGARAARASKEVGDAVIRAPFSGVVAQRLISVGEYVGPGTRVVELVEVDPMRVELSVPEAASGRLARGQTVRFSVSAIPGEELAARVRFIGPALDGKSRNLAVEAVLDRPDTRLKPGMFATTRLTTGEERGLAIQEAALFGAAESPRVWAVRDGRLEERVVSTGEREGGFVMVKKGLSKGERVVVRPSAELRDGQPVE